MKYNQKASRYRLRLSQELRVGFAKYEKNQQARRVRREKTTSRICVLIAAIAMIGVLTAYMYETNNRIDAQHSIPNYNDRSVVSGTATEIKPSFAVDSFDSRVDFSRYHTIGFIGDSLTFGCCWNGTPAPTFEVQMLGADYKAINRAISGTTTTDWVNNLLKSSLKEFKNSKVKIVQIMLGTNDITVKTPTDKIIGNLKEIVNKLWPIGVEIVIVQPIPYNQNHTPDQITSLNDAIRRADFSGNVYIGSGKIYDYLREHPNDLPDRLHMNDDGYKKMAEYWRDDYNQAIRKFGQR